MKELNRFIKKYKCDRNRKRLLIFLDVISVPLIGLIYFKYEFVLPPSKVFLPGGFVIFLFLFYAVAPMCIRVHFNKKEDYYYLKLSHIVKYNKDKINEIVKELVKARLFNLLEHGELRGYWESVD